MRQAIHTAVRVYSLPSVPVHDWASQAANALATLSPELVVGVLVAHLNEQTSSLDVISAGVSSQSPEAATGRHTSKPNTDAPGLNQSSTNHLGASIPRAPRMEHAPDSLYILDKLERLTTLGFPLPAHTCDRGLVAPLWTLQSHWQGTPLGRIFATQNCQSPCIAIVPIAREHPGFALLCILATQPTNATTPSPKMIEHMVLSMGQLVPVLSEKAHLALGQVTNPKAWLTDREQEILDQLIMGNSVRTIAENLGRSTHTVHDHVKNLHKKLDASSRGQLISKALGYRPSETTPEIPAPNPLVLLDHSPLPELKPNQGKQAFPAHEAPPRLQARPMQ